MTPHPHDLDDLREAAHAAELMAAAEAHRLATQGADDPPPGGAFDAQTKTMPSDYSSNIKRLHDG